MSRRRWLVLLVLSGLLAAALLWLAWPELSADAPLAETEPQVTPERIEAGRYLARAGNCIACHTQPGGTEYAGGRRIDTPFGAVYSSNLTPDRRHGLGLWSARDFYRALHQGRSRDGRLLSPAFPYPNYTRLSRADSDSLYVYLRSLPPVAVAPAASRLRFPYNSSLALRVWRALYFRPGALEPQPQRSPAWNRGAYLVEGLGHCGACHTARDRLGGPRNASAYAGGTIPMLGWDAPPLYRPLPSGAGQATELAALLQTGVSRHQAVIGPMAEVVFHSLQYLSREDIAAMVEYLLSLPASAAPPAPTAPLVTPRQRLALLDLGAKVYRRHCADCHGDDGLGRPEVYPALAGSRLLTAASAANGIRITRFGGYPPSTAGNPRPYGMPPFNQRLSDEELAAVLSYVRNSWGNQAPAVSVAEVQRH